MDLKKFKQSISQLAEEKGIPEESVLEIIELAMAAAYKKDYGKKAQKIVAKLDPNTGSLLFWQVKEVVDKDMLLTDEELQQDIPFDSEKIRFNEERHLLLKDAKKIEPDISVGNEINLPLKVEENYGRIAAQTAKQVILQKLKEKERKMIFQEYKQKENQIISGTVQRVGRKEIFFDIGNVLGVLRNEEQIPGEFYKINQRFKLYVLQVDETPKGPMIYLSRAFPKFISKLFELEVPEIANNDVEIKSIAREPGSRTKISVQSHNSEIDPIGATVGQRGTRVSAVITELGGEKIDIINYSEDPATYVGNALSPAKVISVEVLDKNKAICIVPEDQLSLAIGKEGQNVRLAAKLTGWKIDVRSGIEQDLDEESESKSKARIKKADKKTKTRKVSKKPKSKKIKGKAETKKIKKQKRK